MYIVVLISNSPLVPASQDTVQDKSKQTHSGLSSKHNQYDCNVLLGNCTAYCIVLYVKQKNMSDSQLVKLFKVNVKIVGLNASVNEINHKGREGSMPIIVELISHLPLAQ